MAQEEDSNCTPCKTKLQEQVGPETYEEDG